MKVEIWSDLICPFCYIGKRNFEKALGQFSHKDKVEVIWKSFMLNPDMETNPEKNINQYLAEIKGWTLDHAKNMHEHVTKMADKVGLNYDFDRIIVANSLDAHRLIQLAKTKSKGDEAEERLFKAYFIEGKNIADHSTLIQMGTDIGLKPDEIREMLAGNAFIDVVRNDVNEAEQKGITGVPFFVIDGKHTVNGAEPSGIFLKALNDALEEEKRL